ncbi:MAG: hypothetical protein EOP48_03385 [Sphingobacteriales bacterium]|nr:MAG: hypothetical protein EOP48_03385 [Sphingobacteriales bacterium]
MKIKIGIYGGTNLSAEQVILVEGITKALIQSGEVSIVSGGFHYYINHRDHHSVDKVVMETAKKLLPEEVFFQRFETWLPKENDRLNVTRFREGIVKEIPGSTQARRFHMVTHLDALITITGEGNTQSVIELALAINKPVLPIGFTGGDSGKMWNSYRYDIMQRLKLSKSLELKLSQQPILDDMPGLGSEIAEFMKNACQKTCLVLMPFAAENNTYYDNYISRAIEQSGYHKLRIDRVLTAGNIPDFFLKSLEDTTAVIIDITGLNANVMYELGYVHSKKIKPLIVSRYPPGDQNPDNLPFYLKQELVVKESDDDAGYQKIKDYITRYLDANRSLIPSPFIHLPAV